MSKNIKGHRRPHIEYEMYEQLNLESICSKGSFDLCKKEMPILEIYIYR